MNDGACDWVANELTGEAAVLLSETGLAEIAEEPAIWATVHWACDQLAGKLESYLHIDPEDVCSDLGMGRRSAPALDPDTFANLTIAGVKRIMAVRVKKLTQIGKPVLLFADGRKGHCWIDSDTGVYSCLEPTAQTAYNTARHPAAMHYEALATSAASSSSTPAIIASVLGVGLVAALVVCAVLASRLSEARKKEQVAMVTETPDVGANSLHVRLL